MISAAMVNLLVSLGAEKDRHCNGITPLFMAARKGHVKVVDALIQANVDLNIDL